MIKFDLTTRAITLVKGDYGELRLTDLQVYDKVDKTYRSYVRQEGDILRIVVSEGNSDEYPTPLFSVDANEEDVFIFDAALVEDVPCKTSYTYDLKLVLADGKQHTIESLKVFTLGGSVAWQISQPL